MKPQNVFTALAAAVVVTGLAYYSIYAVKKDAFGDTHCSVFVGEFNTSDGAFKIGDVVISVDSIQEMPAAKYEPRPDPARRARH
jgi:hypothetical protein